MQPRFDVDAYCARIGYAGPREPTRAVLDALHLAHATSIPFENLDAVLGRSIALDVEALQAKLVAHRRGGYCFEQNTLFAAALDAIGFVVTRLAARVRLGATAIRPRTHMLLAVDVDDDVALADVGFGSDGLLLPVPLAGATPTRQFAWSYRVVAEAPGVHVMQSLANGAWRDLYAFTTEPQYAVDFELANWYTSTHPTSRFVQTLTAQRLSTTKRVALRDLELTEDDGTDVRMRRLHGPDEQRRMLVETFGIEIGSDPALAREWEAFASAGRDNSV